MLSDRLNEVELIQKRIMGFIEKLDVFDAQVKIVHIPTGNLMPECSKFLEEAKDCNEVCDKNPKNYELIKEKRDKVKKSGSAIMPKIIEWKKNQSSYVLPSNISALKDELKSIQVALDRIPTSIVDDIKDIFIRTRDVTCRLLDTMNTSADASFKRHAVYANALQIMPTYFEKCKKESTDAVLKANAILRGAPASNSTPPAASLSGTAGTIQALNQQEHKRSHMDASADISQAALREMNAKIEYSNKLLAGREMSAKGSPDGKQQSSYFASSGQAVFKPLGAGAYQVAVPMFNDIKSATPVGRLG